MFWLIEEVHADNGDRELAIAASKAGCNVFLETISPFKQAALDEIPAGPFVFHGSIQRANEIREKRPNLAAGIFCEMDRFRCTAYFPSLGKFLFNEQYCFLPVAELQRMKWEIYRWFARDTKIFVRPDAGDKSFTGQLLDLQEFDGFWAKNAATTTAADLVVVAAPKPILAEWRFVVTDQAEIMAVSCYLFQGNRTYVPSAPKGAHAFCREVLAAGWHPEKIYVMDIAQSMDGRFSLLELNAFSTAALYACHKDPVVAAVLQLSSASQS